MGVQLDQLIDDTARSNIRSVAGEQLDNELSLIDSFLKTPLDVSLSSNIITISSSIIQKLKSDGVDGVENGYKWRIPALNGLDISTLSSTINLNDGTTTGDFFDSPANPVSVTANQWIKLGIEVRADGKLHAVWGAEGATRSAATIPAFSKTKAFPIAVIELLNDGTAGAWNFVAIVDSDIQIIKGGSGAGGSSGGANDLLTQMEIRTDNSSFGYMTPSIGAIHEDDLIDPASDTGFDVATDSFIFANIADELISLNLLCEDFLSTEVDLDKVELLVYWDIDNLDPSAVYSVTREGNAVTPNYQTITMERSDLNSDLFRGVLEFGTEPSDTYIDDINTGAFEFKTATPTVSRIFSNANEAFLVRQVRVTLAKTGSPSGGLYFKFVRDNAGSPSTDPDDVINSVYVASASLINGANNIALSAVFAKNTDYHLVITSDTAYNSSYVDTVTEFNIASATANLVELQGRELDLRIKIVSSLAGVGIKGFAVLYKNEAVVALSGTPVDQLLTDNHLGSPNYAVDRSIAGRGIFLRRPDGTLRELTIDNSDNIAIFSV